MLQSKAKMDFKQKIQNPQANEKAQKKKFKRRQNELHDMLIKEKTKVVTLSTEVQKLKKEASISWKAKTEKDAMLIEKNREIQNELDDITVKNEIMQQKVVELQKKCTNSESESKPLKQQVMKLTGEVTSSKEATIKLQEKLTKARKINAFKNQVVSNMAEFDEMTKDIVKKENELRDMEGFVKSHMDKINEYPNMQEFIASLKEEICEAKSAAEGKSMLEKQKIFLIAKLRAAKKRELDLQSSNDDKKKKLQNMQSETQSLLKTLETLESRCKDTEARNESLEQDIHNQICTLKNVEILKNIQHKQLLNIQTQISKQEEKRYECQHILNAYERAHMKVPHDYKEDCLKCLLGKMKAQEESIAKYRNMVEELEEKL